MLIIFDLLDYLLLSSTHGPILREGVLMVCITWRGRDVDGRLMFARLCGEDHWPSFLERIRVLFHESDLGRSIAPFCFTTGGSKYPLTTSTSDVAFPGLPILCGRERGGGKGWTTIETTSSFLPHRSHYKDSPLHWYCQLFLGWD